MTDKNAAAATTTETTKTEAQGNDAPVVKVPGRVGARRKFSSRGNP